MKHAPSFFLFLAAGALVTSTFLTAAVSQDPAGQPQQAAAAPEDDLGGPQFRATCSECHDAARIVGTRRTKAEWQDVILKMIQEGAKGTEKDFEAIHGYLVLHFGKVFVNSARADEISMALGVSKKDADAIVEYRTAHGAFADVDAMKKVPGVDGKKIEEHKEALSFDAPEAPVIPEDGGHEAN